MCRAFGPENIPLLQVGYLGLVEVDAGFRINIARWEDYAKMAGDETTNAATYYASDLRERGVKIAAFSATPQGGGIALMRHACVRYCHCLGVSMKW